jgi:hypothetical protein
MLWAGISRLGLMIASMVVRLLYLGMIRLFSGLGLLIRGNNRALLFEVLALRHECRVVTFMVHDRAAFGGALVAVGTLYTYLICFPLRCGEAWAWWLLTVSGAAGFLSFLAYLGYGYLDTWHGVGTALLLPVLSSG